MRLLCLLSYFCGDDLMPLPSLIDTHAHLDEPSLREELPALLNRATEAGLIGIITIGTTWQSSQTSIELAEQHAMIHAAVGIHPNYVSQAAETDWTEIVSLANHPQVIAVGETGLDRYWDYAPLELQVDYFQRHLELSAATGKPFLVHCRDAEQEVLQVLEQAAAAGPLNGVMHSFCGSPEMAERCLSWGMSLSFSGMLTFKRNAELRELAASVPADRILIETDAPYLAPMPYRGKRNQPAYVKHTAEVLAECRGISFQELCALTTQNAQRLFRLPE